MKSLIVHIGPYKTGSTAIQRVLAASRRSLESAGILYPTSRETLPLEAHHSLARFLRTGPGPGITLVFGPDELDETLRTTSADHVVLSSEGFSNPNFPAAQVAGLASLAESCGFEMTAVAFIRPQAEMMNSWYVQDVKDLRRPGTFAEFAAADNGWLEHNARFSAWSTQPQVRFVAVPFNGEAKGARIAELMLRAGGVADEQIARARLKPAEMVNENPGAMTVAGLRYLMRQHPWTQLELDRSQAYRARDASFVEARDRGWFAEPFVGVDANRARRIAARYATENEAFAQHHWDRSWNDVFAADVARHWVSNEVDLDTAPAEVIDELASYADTFLRALQDMPGEGGKRDKSVRSPARKSGKRGSGNPAKRATEGKRPAAKDAADVPGRFALPKEFKDLL